MKALALTITSLGLFCVSSALARDGQKATDRPLRFVELSSVLDVRTWRNSGFVDYEGALYQDGTRVSEIDESRPYCMVSTMGENAVDGPRSSEYLAYGLSRVTSSWTSDFLSDRWFVQVDLVPLAEGALPSLNIDCWGPATTGLEELSIGGFEEIFGTDVLFGTLSVARRPERPETWIGSQLTAIDLLQRIVVETSREIVLSKEKALRFQWGRLLGDEELSDEKLGSCFLYAGSGGDTQVLPQGTRLKPVKVQRISEKAASHASPQTQPSWILELEAADPSVGKVVLHCENASWRDPPDYPELQQVTHPLLKWIWSF